MSDEPVDVAQLCAMAERCADVWVIEFLDCFNMSGCPSPTDTAIAFSRDSASMIVKECLPGIWRERYGKGFTQQNMLMKYVGNTHYGFGEDLVFGTDDVWIGADAFLMLMSALGLASELEQAEQLVNDWLDYNNEQFQWPAANYYVCGEKWGCAGYSVEFEADTGFRFEVFSDA